MNLYHCTATGPFGQFGDYIFAKTRGEAECIFHNKHGAWPHTTKLERKAK